MEEGKRKFSRIPFKTEVELKIGDHCHHCDMISNLSVGGCLVPIHPQAQPGDDCHVTITLGGTSSRLTLAMKGRIMRTSPEGTAIKFTSIDVDSLFHLKNIVRYNAADTAAVEREIQNHFGIT